MSIAPQADDAGQTAAPEKRFNQGIDWSVTVWLALVHVGAIAGLFFFTWKAVLLTVVLSWLTGGIGICMGYHRLLTHNSFKTYRPIRWLIALLGNLAGQGPPLMWVATHRKHHDFSDQDDDPHSPKHGAWWSHVFWLLPDRGKAYYDGLFDRYAPDLLKDPAMRVLQKTFLLWYFLLGGLLLAVGWIGWDLRTGLSFLFWGMFVRMVYVLHITWLINSATHIWGYRNYETSDDSRNVWWVALLSYGEGWHNNHHAFQRVARYGHRWWEFDITYVTICVMEKLGLAWNVVREIPAGVRTARQLKPTAGDSEGS